VSKMCLKPATFQTTRCSALDRVHNSRQPLDRLFALCDPLTLTYY